MNVELSPLSVLACDYALEECVVEQERQKQAYLALPLRLPVVDVDWVLASMPRAVCNGAATRGPIATKTLAPPRNVSNAAPRARAAAGVMALLVMLLAGSLLHAQSSPPAAASAAPTAAAKAPVAPPAVRSASEVKPLNAGSDPATASLEAYLTRVRVDNKAVQASPGAIWTDAGRLTRMSTDVRAMRPHDLISVVVSENLAASTDGTVKNSRSSNASSAITGLMGTLHSGNAMQNLVNQNSAAGLSAQGASATNSSLSTTLGGQVVEVLPNGMLVIEAARQVEFSQQTQTIVLRGLVRPEDISQENQVLSTAISSLEVQVRGKGIVNDYTHRQNALVRLLERVLVF
jgi:flagellar L-ring protein precursor FlgH